MHCSYTAYIYLNAVNCYSLIMIKLLKRDCQGNGDIIIHVENEKAKSNPIEIWKQIISKKKCGTVLLKLKIQAVLAFAITYMSFYLFIYKIAIHVKSTSCGATTGA